MEDLEAQVQNLEEEASYLTKEIMSTVGGLSDLRYGKFKNATLNAEVLQGLGTLEGTCNMK